MKIASDLKQIWYQTKEQFMELIDKDPLHIISYVSYANQAQTIIRGRIIGNQDILVKDDDTTWEKFWHNIRRWSSDEKKNHPVKIQYRDDTYEILSDKEGYFELFLPIASKPNEQGNLKWETAYISIEDDFGDEHKIIKSEVSILQPHANSQYGIITDIDDTVLVSNVSSFMKLKLLYKTFFTAAIDRKFFEGIQETFKILQQNSKGDIVNPIFYLSHSPWNLYGLLMNFMKINDIPIGPFFLRDYGIKFGKELSEFSNHKSLVIDHLMKFYIGLPFILIGDATQEDTRIYIEAYNKYGKRVKAIFIRKTSNAVLNERVIKLANQSNAPITFIDQSKEITKALSKNR